jgi:hypothetical protein
MEHTVLGEGLGREFLSFVTVIGPIMGFLRIAEAMSLADTA